MVEEDDVPGSDEEPSEASPKERDWDKEAKTAGWNPKGELSARDFVVTKPLRDKIHTLSRKTRDLDAAIVRQEKLHQETVEARVAATIDALEKQKVRAIKDGDADTVVQIDKAIRGEEKKAEVIKAQPRTTAPTPAFEEWGEKNKWYTDSTKMRRWADGAGADIRRAEPNLPEREFLERVEKEAREEFPEAFETKKRVRSVESGEDSTSRGGYGDRGRNEVGWEDIPRDVRPIFESLWKQGTWKSKDGKPLAKPAAARIYAKDLQSVGALREGD
jgi:hypothetical protein